MAVRAATHASSAWNPHYYLSDARKVEIEAKRATGPVHSLTRLANNWLGALPAETFFGWKLTVVDGFLYLGPLSAYTHSPFDYRPVDEEDRVELRRGVQIWGDESCSRMRSRPWTRRCAGG